MTRLVAVLGYSTRRGDGLHPICAARLEAAERATGSDDTVLLSGWSRRRPRLAEAELMRAAWRGLAVPVLADAAARTTVGNVRAVAAAAQALGADEVVLVTSSWHARRALLLARAALGPAIQIRTITPERSRPPHLVARELALLLPTRTLVGLSRIRPRRR